MTTVKACSILIQNLKHVHVLLHDTFQYELLQTILKNRIKKDDNVFNMHFRKGFRF